MIFNLKFGVVFCRFGRRPTFLIGVLSLLIAGVIASVAPNMFVFVPMYFLQGAAHTGAFLVAFTVCKSNKLYILFSYLFVFYMLIQTKWEENINVNNIKITALELCRL